MKFQSVHVKGKGKGKTLGVPTINLAIPKDFDLAEGIYAAWVTIAQTTYKGALYFGPIPVFGQKEKSLEVYLLNIHSHETPDPQEEPITIDVVKKIRDVRSFESPELMVKQIALDVSEINTVLTQPEGIGAL